MPSTLHEWFKLSGRQVGNLIFDHFLTQNRCFLIFFWFFDKKKDFFPVSTWRPESLKWNLIVLLLINSLLSAGQHFSSATELPVCIILVLAHMVSHSLLSYLYLIWCKHKKKKAFDENSTNSCLSWWCSVICGCTIPWSFSYFINHFYRSIHFFVFCIHFFFFFEILFGINYYFFIVLV